MHNLTNEEDVFAIYDKTKTDLLNSFDTNIVIIINEDDNES